MKYKLIFGLMFIAFNGKAHVPGKDEFQLKIPRQIIEFKIDPETFFENDSSSEAEIKRLSKLWMDAMLRHDSTLLNELMAPEYRLQRWDGKVLAYRAAWLDNLFHNIKITH